MTKCCEYELWDVFTSTRFAGNPLAVFKDGSGINPHTMGRVAAELNLSETAFLVPPRLCGDRRLRIYTPTMELPFAGHPTIGAALALRADDARLERVQFEVQAGCVNVEYEREKAFLESPVVPSTFAVEAGRKEAAALLGVDEVDVADCRGAEAGVPFTMIELRNPGSVARCELSRDVWSDVFSSSPAPHIYVFAGAGYDAAIVARMFAPAMGIDEDPATGGGAVALAALLEPGRYEISQGDEIGRPSRIELEVGNRVRVGGEAVKLGEGRLMI